MIVNLYMIMVLVLLIKALVLLLKELNVPLIARDTGLNYGRTVVLDCSTGDYLIKSVGKPEKTI